MGIVNTHEAKTNLSRLIDEVQKGAEVVIARANRPVARLVPIREKDQVLIRYRASAPGLFLRYCGWIWWMR